MSEEEIIKYLEKVAKEKTIMPLDNYIQGLLDLYNKEKEKNISLNQELAKRNWVKVKENGEIEPLFYIPKSKVKEKIDRIQDLQINYVDGITFDHIILELEELLEGDN